MSQNQQHIISELHQACTRVYCGTRELPVKNQRGKLYVNYKGHQINIKDIPEQYDEEFDYIFNFGWRDRPNKKLSEHLKAEHSQKYRQQHKIVREKEKTKLLTIKKKTGEILEMKIEASIDSRKHLEDLKINFTWFKEKIYENKRI